LIISVVGRRDNQSSTLLLDKVKKTGNMSSNGVVLKAIGSFTLFA